MLPFLYKRLLYKSILHDWKQLIVFTGKKSTELHITKRQERFNINIKIVSVLTKPNCKIMEKN